MLQFTPIRTAIIAIVALLAVLYAVPNFLNKDQLAAWPGFLPKQTMTLGLDLQGGSYLLLQVNKDGIVKDRLAELRRDARNILANQNGIGNIITISGTTLSVELTDPTQRAKADQVLQALQNNVGGSIIGVGGVKELAFSDTPDGKIAITLSADGVEQRMYDRAHNPAAGLGPRAGTGAGLPGFLAPQGHYFQDRSADLPFGLSEHVGGDRQGAGPAAQHHHRAEPGWRRRAAL